MASSLDEKLSATALGLDSAVSQAMFMTGPALAAGIATTLGATWFFPATCALLALSLLVVARVPSPERLPDGSERSATRLRRLVPLLLPGAIASVAVMALVATLDTTLPGQLEAINKTPAWAGPMLGLMAAGSIVTSLLYGARAWPGNPADQAMLCCVLFGVATIALSLMSAIEAMVVIIVVAGVCQAPALTARNVSVTTTVPPAVQPAAFSILYACGGIGYALSSAYVAVALDRLGPATTQTIAAVATVLLVAAAWVVELLRRRPRTSAPAAPFSSH